MIIGVACLSEDPNVVLGYSVVERKDEDVLHWIHVKFVWRKIGIAKALLKPFDIKATTHLTTLGEQLKPKHMIFNPFAI